VPWRRFSWARWSRILDPPKVTVDVKDATLEETLNQIITPNRLSYKVVDERSMLIVRVP